MRPKASRLSRYIVMPKTTSVQIISPGLGLTSSASAKVKGMATVVVEPLGDEEGDERHQQGVERDGLRQRQAEEHQAHQVAAQLRLARDALDRLADQVA